MNETRTTQPTPEQLIKLLDSQFHLARAKRATVEHTPRRTTLLVGGLLFIVGGGCAALLFLQNMFSDLRRHPPAANAETAQSTERNENFQEAERRGTSSAKTN